MDEFGLNLNQLIVDVFRNIERLEAQICESSSKIKLNINEVHLISNIGKGGMKSISDIADMMFITTPSATVAVNKLVQRGFLQKVRCKNDGRVVYVTLTESGEYIDRIHSYFHYKMINELCKGLAPDEKSAMLKGVVNLKNFFEKNLKMMEDMQ